MKKIVNNLQSSLKYSEIFLRKNRE